MARLFIRSHVSKKIYPFTNAVGSLTVNNAVLPQAALDMCSSKLQIVLFAIITGFVSLAPGAENQPKNNGEYDLHEDGGIIYNPLSREAQRKGEVEKFKGIALKTGTLHLADTTLSFEVPQSADAYDVVPVRYVLNSKRREENRPIAIECTAFEEQSRSRGIPLFDMSLPGDLSVKMEYIGCVCADAAESRPLLDPKHPNAEIKAYPAWKSDTITRSGVIRKADLHWFTFRYTVTGNTIFDPEGFNGVQTEIGLYRKQDNGEYKFVTNPINQWERNVNYQYPGEACEQTVLMPGGKNVMLPGEYKIRFHLLQKAYSKWSLFKNHWGGEPFAYMDVYLSVVDKEPMQVKPKVNEVICATARSGNFPEYIHSFQEFMTGFEWYRKPISTESSVVYVQVAPWTNTINVKLIMGDPMEVKSSAIPIEISTKNLTLKYNLGNPFVATRNGKEEPVIMAQLMPSMRHSIHFGPRPDIIMEELVKDAQVCGVNVYCSESGGWALQDFFRTPQTHDACGEATRYFNRMLKQWGMPMVGHGVYPVEDAYKFGNMILEPPLALDVEMTNGYGAKHFGYREWSQTWAAVVLYHHKLWGDNWYKIRDGKTIIDIEDSTGWLREGLQIRYPVGSRNISDFQQWCRKKYSSINEVNRLWASSYKNFEEINPEANQSASRQWGHKWEYYKATNPVFYDWSPAINDFDSYLSEARCNRYKEVIEIVRKTIPGAVIDLRTEGGNFIIPDASKLGNTPHELHIKYSARRNAEIGEVLSRFSDVIGFYSDYTTLPYTPEEWRKFTRLSVEKGIRPMPLPHMARTRDMAVQKKYGEDWTVHYNLKYPAKATMIFGLQACFPVMKAIYEEGGCCGIIWADYLCDAFVTETQKRELKILRDAMNHMKSL